MTTQELVDKYFDAVNNHRWDQLGELFHPDVIVQHGMTLSTTGREKAIKLLAAVVGQLAEHEDTPTRTLIDGNVAVVEIKFTGARADGTAVEFEAVDVIDTDGVLITKVASWYDSAAVLARING